MQVCSEAGIRWGTGETRVKKLQFLLLNTHTHTHSHLTYRMRNAGI